MRSAVATFKDVSAYALPCVAGLPLAGEARVTAGTAVVDVHKSRDAAESFAATHFVRAAGLAAHGPSIPLHDCVRTQIYDP